LDRNLKGTQRQDVAPSLLSALGLSPQKAKVNPPSNDEHTCKVCGKIFYNVSNLRRHMKSDGCSSCAISFDDKNEEKEERRKVKKPPMKKWSSEQSPPKKRKVEDNLFGTPPSLAPPTTAKPIKVKISFEMELDEDQLIRIGKQLPELLTMVKKL